MCTEIPKLSNFPFLLRRNFKARFLVILPNDFGRVITDGVPNSYRSCPWPIVVLLIKHDKKAWKLTVPAFSEIENEHYRFIVIFMNIVIAIEKYQKYST